MLTLAILTDAGNAGTGNTGAGNVGRGSSYAREGACAGAGIHVSRCRVSRGEQDGRWCWDWFLFAAMERVRARAGVAGDTGLFRALALSIRGVGFHAAPRLFEGETDRIDGLFPCCVFVCLFFCLLSTACCLLVLPCVYIGVTRGCYFWSTGPVANCCNAGVISRTYLLLHLTPPFPVCCIRISRRTAGFWAAVNTCVLSLDCGVSLSPIPSPAIYPP